MMEENTAGETKGPATAVQREKSGIPGLDDALKGGFPARNIILVTGTPGAGKTTMAMQSLVYGAINGEKGIYFTLEESVDDVIDQFSMFDGVSIKQLTEKGMLKVISIPLVDYDSLKDMISNEIDSMGAKRVVIDSITYLQLFFSDVMSIRRAIIEVAALLKSKKCFGIFVGEMSYGDPKMSSFGVEEFATDGVIALYMLEKNTTFIRALRIIKMRKTDHITKYIPIEITDKGVVTHPNEELFTEI